MLILLPLSRLSFNFNFITSFIYCAKTFRFNYIHLFVFAFISFPLGEKSKKEWMQFISKTVLSMFSTRSYMISDYLIHFEFIFIWCEKMVYFILSHVVVQLF